ncbi:hypothetical protein RBI14_22380 [Alcaligenaceae bacterium B3P038]|nr:hypothetical protein [Alcaligenaceae bacterium B3P038]
MSTPRLIACLMAALLTSLGATRCASREAAGLEYCAIAKPIYVAAEDELTDLTARQTLSHNGRGRALCKW